MKVKVPDTLDNVTNENIITTKDRRTDRQSDKLLELLVWLFATKNWTTPAHLKSNYQFTETRIE